MLTIMMNDTQQPEPAVEPVVQPTAEPAAQPAAAVPAPVAPAAAPARSPSSAGQQRGGQRFGFARGGAGGGQRGGAPGRGGQRPGGNRPGGPRHGEQAVESDYEEKNVEVARVTRVTKGGKRMRFRVLSVIGNRKGRVGFGLGKGIDVAAATAKATTKARKALITVPLVNDTIPHQALAKFAAAEVLIKPAPKGSGVKAGGAVRVVLELAGIPNVVSKILGSSNKINNVNATMKALRMLKAPAKKVGDAPAKASESSATTV